MPTEDYTAGDEAMQNVQEKREKKWPRVGAASDRAAKRAIKNVKETRKGK